MGKIIAIIFLLCAALLTAFILFRVEKAASPEPFIEEEVSLEDPSPEEIKPEEVLPTPKEPVNPEEVPFLVQAPFGEWAEEIFENACEEASIIMAKYWLDEASLTPEKGKEEILELVTYQKKKFGHSIDTSPEDTSSMLRDFYGVHSSKVRSDVTLSDMREIISEGAIFIAPADGRKLKNPHFTQPGPPVHMLLVIGYDEETKEFITNDPGTRFGKGYRYPEEILYAAMGDYKTGRHVTVDTTEKKIIQVSRPE